MNRRALATLLLLSTTTACLGGAPPIAARHPRNETIRDLEAKAAAITSQTLTLVDESGLLLYRALTPLSKEDNFLESHDLADAPAWQGVLMAAFAFEEAVSGRDRDPELLQLAQGLLGFYKASGQPGLLGRSHLVNYQGPRLPWMADKAFRPTKYWLQGPEGRWWRCGLAKGHFNEAMFGCAIPLALDRRGEIHLDPTTRQALLDVLLPAVKRFVDADFKLIEHDGDATEFGNLGPQLLNGFNMAVTLHVLASAAPYDARYQALYRDMMASWGGRMGFSLEALGEVIALLGHWRIDKPSYSDMQQLACASLSLFLQDEEEEHQKKVKRAVHGLWEYVQYERNLPYVLVYSAFIAPGSVELELGEVLEDLRDFPADKTPRAILEEEDTKEIQPLCNRPLNTHYWKSSPYRRVLREGEPLQLLYSGQDYLLAYWLGRYLKLVPAH